MAGAGAAWPLQARAQQKQGVAILTPSNSQWQPRTFREALSELGYREGVNLSLEVISAENQRTGCRNWRLNSSPAHPT
jgi:hypothetical protein